MAVGAESLRPARERTIIDLRSIVSRGLGWIEREAFPLTIAALYGVVLLLLMPGELVQDSWATLVAGREVAEQGLPHRETLTVMAQGVRWVDQQWLAQVAFYELFRVGGYRLMLLAHVALLVTAFGLALVAARRRGASAVSVFLVGCACFFVAPWGWQLRAQSFAPLLFVLVLSLLISDGRAPSKKVFAVLPLLALWANLHGSVVLVALLVMLYGLGRLVDRRRETVKGAVLLLLAPLMVLCSPYALDLVGYYRRLLIDPPFGQLVVEWQPPTPGPITAVFYVLAFATVWAIGRWGGRLSRFERICLLVTLVAALQATRSIIWFGLTALILVPTLLDETRVSRAKPAHPAVRTSLAVVALGGVAAALLVTAAKPAAWYEQEWPAASAQAVAAATEDRSARVFASDRRADWLLWRIPQLRGRIAFDVRFELNTGAEIKRLQRFFGRTGNDWQAAARGYDVIALDRDSHEKVRRSLLAKTAIREVYLDRHLAVLARTAAGADR